MRRRVFLMAVRMDVMGEPLPDEPVQQTHSAEALRYAQWVGQTYWHEHGITPQPRPDRQSDEIIRRLQLAGPPRTSRWRTVRDAITGNLEIEGIGDELPEPIDAQEVPGYFNHVGIPGARSYPGHTGSDLDWVAKTVKAGVHGVCGGEAMTRDESGSLRYWTVRESARIQSFPDCYQFVGARSRAMRHIGNAVAVEVARIVGKRLRELAGV